MDMSEVPEPWSRAAERAGVRATYRGIGERAGLSHVTVRRLIAEGRTSPTTIGKVAAALSVEESTIYEWAGVPVSEWGPWVPPREAHNLNPRARAALEELIRAVTAEGASDAGTTHQKMPEPQGRGAYGTAARPGVSETDRYRQSIADVGEESQDLEG